MSEILVIDADQLRPGTRFFVVRKAHGKYQYVAESLYPVYCGRGYMRLASGSCMYFHYIPGIRALLEFTE